MSVLANKLSLDVAKADFRFIEIIRAGVLQYGSRPAGASLGVIITTTIDRNVPPIDQVVYKTPGSSRGRKNVS